MYQQTVSRKYPGLVVFMIDRSDSMWRTWAGTRFSLAEGAAQAVNRILFDLCIKSTKEVGAPLRNYFYVGELPPVSRSVGYLSASRWARR